MASFILILSLIVSFISSAHSLTCTSQSFQNRTFAHCDDLPYLNAFLHWTYDPDNSSLSVAFLAAPPHSDGWVAWAINPTSTGMPGAQALIASLTGSIPIVRSFNVSSYSNVLPSPVLSFPFWDLAAEYSEGRLTVFVTVKVPAKATSVNQVWQVGSAGGHEFKPANLKARRELMFDNRSGSSSSPSAADSTSGTRKGGVAGIRSADLGFVVGFIVFIWGIISF